MSFTILLEKLNPEILEFILDEILDDKINFLRIEISFMNGEDHAYPNFDHNLKNFKNSFLTKAEIAAYLYLHYKKFDIEDYYIDYVILTISAK